MNTTQWVGTVVVLVAGLGCGRPAAPFEKTERTLVKGTARTVLEAGPYQYVEIETQDKTTLWVATLARELAAGQGVEAVVLGRRVDFHSARLQRDFNTLAFGPVRPVQQGAGQ